MKRILACCFSLTILTSIFYSCDESGAIGSNILPPEDDIYTARVDTFEIKAWSEAVENTITSGLDAYLLGAVDDPIFGKSSASFFLECRLPTNDNNWGADTAIFFDSLVLTLRVVDFYGDTLSPSEQTFNIKRISERMSEDSVHRSDTVFPTEPVNLVSSFTYTPNLEDSLTFFIGDDTIKEPPQLRIPFSSSFGSSILGLSGQSVVADDDNWLDFLSGFYIETDTSGGFGNGLMTVNPFSTYSGLEMYYRRVRRLDSDGDGTITAADTTITDTLLVNFPIKSPSTSFSPSVTVGHYTHNYSGTVIEGILSDTSNNDSILPVQGMQGIYAQFEIPNLEDLGTVAINKATLLVKQTGGTQGELEFTPPTRLFSYTGTGLDTIINDLLLGETHYGGGFEEVMTDDGSLIQQYEINLTWHLQSILNGAVENRTLLIPFPYFRIPDRVILGGATHPDDRFRMELVITYTEIE